MSRERARCLTERKRKKRLTEAARRSGASMNAGERGFAAARAFKNVSLGPSWGVARRLNARGA